MASLVYDSTVDDMARGNVVFADDSFQVMLVTGAYVPDKAGHTKRSDVTGEIVGAGYVPGGLSATVSVSTDLIEDRTDIALGGVTWPLSTILAAGAVYYKARGGADSADELVAFIDFGGNVESRAGDFTLEASTIRIQN